jgi:hypothetical protein
MMFPEAERLVAQKDEDDAEAAFFVKLANPEDDEEDFTSLSPTDMGLSILHIPDAGDRRQLL